LDLGAQVNGVHPLDSFKYIMANPAILNSARKICDEEKWFASEKADEKPTGIWKKIRKKAGQIATFLHNKMLMSFYNFKKSEFLKGYRNTLVARHRQNELLPHLEDFHLKTGKNKAELKLLIETQKWDELIITILF